MRRKRALAGSGGPARVGVAALVLAALAAAALPALAESSSASFVLKQSTTNTGGDVSSNSFRLTGSGGQEATVGTSSSFHFVLQSGFWSFAGSGLVPVILFAERNVVRPDNVDLSWSGNNSPYDIYQSTDCAAVFSFLLDTTASNFYDDIAPPPARLVCYSVLASAPGPVPPPGESSRNITP